MSTIAEARRRVRFAAGAAVLWCAALWFLALQLTDESRTRIALAIPVLISATAWLLVPTRVGRAIALAAAGLTMLFALVAILSIGMLYLPAAVALAFAGGGVVQHRKVAAERAAQDR